MSESIPTFMKSTVAIAIVAAATLCSPPARAQTISTVAGDGALAFAGDGGPATSAALNLPKGMAIDASGALYIADSGNFRVRRVSNGMITTVAGNGFDGFSGDGGPATSASFSDVSAVVVDPAGNLYIADPDNRRIRKVTPAGIVSTYAGIGVEGFSGDGGPATSAMIGRPEAMALDGSGNLYFADSTRQRIRKLDANGTITTVAGNGIEGFSGDGGQALNASFDFPIGITVDRNGNIYVADGNNNRIRKISPGGIITTFAGNGVAASAHAAGDGGLATSASLNIPSDVAVDASGNVYIADSGHNEVRVVNPSGMITTVAGTGQDGFSGDGGAATAAMLNFPWGLVADASGNVFVADRVNSRVRLISAGSPVSAPSFRTSPNPILNAASFSINAAIAPGAIVAIFGSNFAIGTAIAQTLPYPKTLSGTSVTFNGEQAPLYFVSSGQINAQVPYDISPGSVAVQVNRGGAMSSVQTVSVASFSPGIYIIDSSTNGGAILHGLTLAEVNTASPAQPGEVVAIFGTGLGALTVPVPAGFPAPTTQPLAQTITTPIVTIGGLPAAVDFSGLTPGLAGLYQVNVHVPLAVQPGLQPVQISVGGTVSNVANIAISR